MGCSLQSVLTQVPRVAVGVDGVEIPHDAIARELQHHPQASQVRAWQEAARALVVRELLLQEARRQGLVPEARADAAGRREAEDEALIRHLIEREVSIPEPDDDVCRRYYDRNRTRFRSAEIFEATHILVAARRGDAAAFTAARERAEALLAALEREPARFSELAAACSACPSASQGGNLGQIMLGDTTPEFEQALLSLKPGGMTAAPVETRYGFHIIRLDRRVQGHELPFDLVRKRIAEYLTERARRLGLAQYIARLAGQAAITGVSLPTATDLRVF